ncbi:MOSC domain-containing protein [Deinococcus arenicola]|uniref:MOSC domain-containing protein n=1 Tax=Deinococcus arenicola TaxID=2994950 RepID=A0ABU4DMZ3_9DEIO|nr:MOSC domain-containing protein [Deinococcus sp. ZS9-10]MDV6373469.1 MOSC domain-containing protein [Deinococcus sp. ZS9-10]
MTFTQPSSERSGADRKLLSVNIGQPTPVDIGPRREMSGIDKQPLPGRVRVTEGGLAGDHVLDTRHHGGPDQAVYVYTQEDYAHWEAKLGRPLPPGFFGENLVIDGLESAAMRIGDQLEIGGAGGVRLEVTAPRIPCGLFAAHIGDPAFVKTFKQVARPGFYTRVLRGGEVGTDDGVRLIPGSADAPSIGDLFALHYKRSPDPQKLEAYLKFPLAVRVRANLEKKLTKARA